MLSPTKSYAGRLCRVLPAHSLLHQFRVRGAHRTRQQLYRRRIKNEISSQIARELKSVYLIENRGTRKPTVRTLEIPIAEKFVHRVKMKNGRDGSGRYYIRPGR